MEGNKQYRVLSIDAWADDEDSWTWNNWFKVGDISKEEFEKLKTDKDYIDFFIEEGYIKESAQNMVEIDDDQYNIVICDKSNSRPLFAIEYGNQQ